jgi:hypothetical protein
MRSTLPLLALSFALATAGSALAAAGPGATGATTTPDSASMPGQPPGGAIPPDQATQAEPSTPPSSAAQPPAPDASSAGATGANTSATAPANFQVGQQVQDNTGATIGSISSLGSANGEQTAVINMGGKTFQVPTSRLGVNNGAAEINLTQAQIATMLNGSAAGH